MANVAFVLDAIATNATRVFRQLESSQTSATRGFERTARSAKKAADGYNAIGRQITGLAARFTGPVGLIAGVTAYANSLNAAVENNIRFEKSMTALFSLGDNVRNMKGLREEVLQYSTAWAQTDEQVAQAMFNIQSGASNLSKQIQEDVLKQSLLFTKFYGGELPTNLQAVVKAANVYVDSVGNVGDITAKLGFGADRAAVTVDDLAKLLPDVASAADTFNISLDELISALIIATQVGGRNERTFTGVRNIILRLSNATKEGISLQGDFVDKIKQLSEVDPDTLKKIFGDEAISALASLTANADKLRQTLKETKEIGSGFIEEKLMVKMADETTRMVDAMERLKTIEANVRTGQNLEGFPGQEGVSLWQKLRVTGAAAHPNAPEPFGFPTSGFAGAIGYIEQPIEKGFRLGVAQLEKFFHGIEGGRTPDDVYKRIRDLKRQPWFPTTTDDLLAASKMDAEAALRRPNAIKTGQDYFRKFDDQGPQLFTGPIDQPNKRLASDHITEFVKGMAGPIKQATDWLAKMNEQYPQYQGAFGALRLNIEAAANTARAKAEAEKKATEAIMKEREERLKNLESMGLGEDPAIREGDPRRRDSFIQAGESIESYMKRTGVRDTEAIADRRDQDAYFNHLGRQQFGPNHIRHGRAFMYARGGMQQMGYSNTNSIADEWAYADDRRADSSARMNATRAVTININQANFASPAAAVRMANARAANSPLGAF